MSDTSLDSASEETLIDAEFTPAAKTETKDITRRGPGWFSFFLLLLISGTALTLGTVNFLKPVSSEPVATASQADLDRLETETTRLSAFHSATSDGLDRLEARLDDTSALDALNEQLAALQTQFAAANDKITALETAPTVTETIEPDPTIPESAPNTSDLARVRQRLDTLDAQIQDISDRSIEPSESNVTAAELDTFRTEMADALAALETRIAALEENQETQSETEASVAHLAQAALAFTTLDRAARNGEPFVTAYTELSAALPGEAAVQALLPYASAPPPSWGGLRRSFNQQRIAARDAAQLSDSAAPSWFQSLVGDGIRVRRTGGDSADEQLQAAAEAINGDTPDAAIEIIRGLDPNIQASFTDWLQKADARQTLDRDLDQIRDTLLIEDRP